MPGKRKLTPKEIKETLKNGWYLFKQGKLVLAYDQFEKILNAKLSYIHPKIYANAMFGVGMIFKDRKRFREAKTCFKKAYEKNSGNIMYLREYGGACKGMQWYSEAIRAWEECLLFRNNDIWLLVRIAESYDLLGNFVMAKKYYSKAYEISPKNKDALLGFGYLYYHNHIYLDAIYYWEKLVYEKQFFDSGILLRLGYCYHKREEYEKAIEYYQKVHSLDEKNIYSLYGLVRTYRKLGDKEREKAYYKKLSSIKSDFRDIMVMFADYHKKGKNYGKV